MQETKEIIKQVRKIEITTKNLVDSITTGSYHSIFKGQGIEFSEIKDYQFGNDVRAIDWKVTARFDKPFIKTFIEERDLRTFFVFDYSGSGNFGNLIEKRRKAIEITATLMFSAIRNNDNVGLFIFTDEVEKYIPSRKGKKHALKILSSLVSHKPKSQKTDIKKTLSYVANVIKKRSIIFIVTDLYDENFIKQLNMLQTKHDVIIIRINDLREKSIPDVGLIQLEDEETGEQILVDTSDEEFRNNYESLIKKKEEKTYKMLKKFKIDSIDILTDEPYDLPLKKFFKLRKGRRV